MLIRVKAGSVEIEYSEPTEETHYPKCTGLDKNRTSDDTYHSALLKTISEMADKAAKIHKSMYE